MPAVALFVTCVVDQLAPEVGIGAVRLLEAAGATVEFPRRRRAAASRRATRASPKPRRTSPATSSTCSSPSRPWSRHPGRASRWCTTGTSGCSPAATRERARELAAKTYELTSYPGRRARRRRTSARGVDASVTVHDACHGLRNLGVRGRAPSAARSGRRDHRRARGAGDVLRVRRHLLGRARRDRDAARRRQARARRRDRRAAGSSAVTVACLLHLAGRRRRTGHRSGAGAHRRSSSPRAAGPHAVSHGVVTPGATLAARARPARSPIPTCSTRSGTSTAGSSPPATSPTTSRS